MFTGPVGDGQCRVHGPSDRSQQDLTGETSSWETSPCAALLQPVKWGVGRRARWTGSPFLSWLRGSVGAGAAPCGALRSACELQTGRRASVQGLAQGTAAAPRGDLTGKVSTGLFSGMRHNLRLLHFPGLWSDGVLLL